MIRLFYALNYRISDKQSYKTFTVIHNLEEADDREAHLASIHRALDLLETYDFKRYRRFSLDVPRIRISNTQSYGAAWNNIAGECEIDVAFLGEMHSNPLAIASTLVYAGTVARAHKMVARYSGDVAVRARKVGVRQQRVFLQRVPTVEAVDLLVQIERQLDQGETYWSAEELRSQKREALSKMGLPNWFNKLIAWTFWGRAT